MTHPAIIANRFLFGRLAPGGVIDATLAAALVGGVWPDAVPEAAGWGTDSAPTYHVVYAAQAWPNDTAVFPSIRVEVEPLYRVTVDGRVSDLARLEAAVARVDALLHGASGAVSGGYCTMCVRERPLLVGPLFGPGAVTTYRIGGLYRLALREE